MDDVSPPIKPIEMRMIGSGVTHLFVASAIGIFETLAQAPATACKLSAYVACRSARSGSIRIKIGTRQDRPL
jgi:hypothetical protein